MPAARYTRYERPEELERIRGLVAAGKSDRQIAEALGVTPCQLSNWRRDRPKIKAALRRIVTIDGKPIDAHDLPHGGRRKIDNVIKLQDKIDSWLEACARDGVPPTRSGLCLMLGITKDTLARYMAESDAPGTVYGADPITGEMRPVTVGDALKRAMLAVEHELELRMLTGKGNVAGVIFDLKNNCGYADKSETVSTQTVTKITDDAEIDARIKELLDRQEQGRPFREQSSSSA